MSCSEIDESIVCIIRKALGSDFTLYDNGLVGSLFEDKGSEILTRKVLHRVVTAKGFVGLQYNSQSALVLYFIAIPVDVDVSEYTEAFKNYIKSISTKIYVNYYNNGWRSSKDITIDEYKSSGNMYSEEWVRKSTKALKFGININLLLCGEPGTGKSHFSIDIAVALRKNVYIIDSQNIGSLTNCQNSGVYLIEEIDKLLMPNGEFCDGVAKNVDKLLSFLDGVLRPRKSIIIVTCNDIERVKKNKVLCRPGRVSNILKFGLLDETQCRSLCNRYYSDADYTELWDKVKDMKITVARLSDYIKDMFVNESTFAEVVSNAEMIQEYCGKDHSNIYG